MSNQSKFNHIRPFYDGEVNEAIKSVIHDPMMTAIMRFTFPNTTDEAWQKKLLSIHSTQDFQGQIVSKILSRVLTESSEGLTTSGFDKLDKNTSYLFISNHRDILLDTSLINLSLFYNKMILTASAIGDNLLQKPFLYTLSKINRNFIVHRGLTPRELLQSSKLMSEYIHELITQDQRSVWLAQREGRTKDGNDGTQSGILKMLGMAAEKGDLLAHFKSLNIVPISISYEYDPTDALKMPELLANLNNEKYVKSENEDFNTILKGLTGQKKRIRIHAGEPINAAIDQLTDITNANQQIKAVVQLIDRQIIKNYKLWSSNYIAFDALLKTDKYAKYYTLTEKTAFMERMSSRIDVNNAQSVAQFLGMYANPVLNKVKINDIEG
ncbi:MAG: glycerol acyltransferase [Saprospiraceae bacterium]|nr:glycerol acyltransferase [Saprospiraceae bacterium]